MKHLRIKIIIFLAVALPIHAFCQELDDFNEVLNKQKLTISYVKRYHNDISERKCIGLILDNKSSLKYYVVNETRKKINNRHENSRILFFSEQKILIAEVKLSMSNELPFYLKDNTLYFDYAISGKRQTYSVQISSIPKAICTKPKSCYTVKFM